MKILGTETSPLIYARIAGLLYLLMFSLGILGILYVPSTLIVSGDAAATANNIMASESLFRLSIVSALLIQIVQIFLVLVLYKLLKPVNKIYALFMVVFALAAVPIAMLNELNNIAALLLLKGSNFLTIFKADQLHAQVMFFLDLHEHGIFIAQIFWGLWLYPMGYLVFKSNFIPKIIGIFLIVACLGYLLGFVKFFIFPNFDLVLIEYMSLGEIPIIFWLLIKGVNVEQWEKRAFESAEYNPCRRDRLWR